ncbi:MAG TPA: N,N-dimethylformamidase beta subunit family domain-containing protein [Gaiellaceae bacterium]
MSRRALIGAGAAAAAGLGPGRVRAAASREVLVGLQVGNDAAPFAGDHAMLTTLSPAGPRGRTRAMISFQLLAPANVQLHVVARNKPGEAALASEGAQAATRQSAVATQGHALNRGHHRLTWQPDPALTPGTYTLELIVTARGKRTVYGAGGPEHPKLARAPVVRLLGLDAAFAQRSYRPGDQATLVLAADARNVTVQMFQVGPETVPTYANDELNGVAVSDPQSLDWSANVDRPAPITLPIDGSWPSGVYYAKVTSDDGRLGFAPVVVAPPSPNHRIAVVLPTNTWAAYNFYDGDGDGYGDSWYVSWAIHSVDLTRPHLRRGVPYRFRSYELSFLHWLYQAGKPVDFYSEEDLDAFESGDVLRASYDLVVFPGHTEYVTTHEYDVTQRFRDLGGNLMFLSANNFFRRVDRLGQTLKLVGLWRDLGRPEAALAGVQYRASDRGTHQYPFVLTDEGAASWALAGTGLAAGGTFGRYGIEIDATTPDSPPGTQVLAEIPNALGPGLTAQMTYYETLAGAKVFSAGALNFGGEVLLWETSKTLLENVWQRLASD